jgi:integrase
LNAAVKTRVCDFVRVNHPKSLVGVTRRIVKHLMPVFGGRRLVGIKTDDVLKYIIHRQAQGIVNRKGERISDVSNAEVNRSLQTLKRIFNLAIEQDRIATKPTIKLLPESAPRSGFFEREQYEAVLKHLPEPIRPVVTFAYITGWRVHDEVLPLEWRQVDFAAREVRLDAGTTKNREGRVFPMTADLRAMLTAQWAAQERLKQAGIIFPQVFFREVAEGRGGKKHPKVITSFNKSWKLACRLAGCPGRIPHDMRRTAIRNFVRSGTAENVAMKLSGHKTRSVFDRYDIVSGADLREAARKLDAASTLQAKDA